MVKMQNVSFQYKSDNDKSGVCDIDLEISKGEVVIICGESGCGKTTLTRLINGLIPHYFDGELRGEVLIDGENSKRMPLHETAQKVGSVFQNPRSQFFSVDTNSELVFACENQGLPVDDIGCRVKRTVENLQIGNLMGRSIFELSGGEKQKIACGSVHTADSEIIVLDEPSSNLDAKGTADLARIIANWKTAGKTIIIAEHRLHYLQGIADRMIFMRNGKIEKEFDLHEKDKVEEIEFTKLGLRAFSLQLLLSEMELLDRTSNYKNDMELRDFSFKYKNGQHVLNINSLELPRGQIIAVIGENGAGKSTFAKCLCGLPKHFKGKVRLGKKHYHKKKLLQGAYMVMQDVNHQLFTESVLDEIMLSMKSDDEHMAEEILNSLNLLHMKERHPMSLSGGQKQRVAIGSALASNREVIIFDEPTSGLDLNHMKKVSQLLKKLKEIGKTIFIISHDLELLLWTCDYVIHIEKGQVREEYNISQNEQQLISFFAS